MFHQFTLLSAALFLAGALILGLGIIAWRRRKAVPAARPFAALMLAMAVYTLGYGFELTSATLPAALFWVHVKYLGIPFLPLAWILIAARFTGRDRWITTGSIAILSLVPAVVLAAVSTMRWHGLYYIAPRLRTDGFVPLLAFDKGPIYWLNTAYMVLAFLFGSLMYFRSLWRAVPPYRGQATAMVVGSLFPWAAYTVYILGASPYGIDITAFALTLSSTAFAVGIFRYRFLDIAPLARYRVFEGMRDGVIVLDAYGRIVDFNAVARTVIPALDASSIGLSGRSVLPAIERGGRQAELTLPVDGEERYFEVRSSPLHGKRSRLLGRVVTLIDVTEHHRLASVDDLTGIDNRRSFLLRGRQELARGRRFNRPATLIFMDIDFFKRVNDTYGHDAGDAVLRSVAAACRPSLRDFDLFGRYGGEEFSFFLPETPLEMGMLAAERLRVLVGSSPVDIGGRQVVVTASFGVVGTSTAGSQTIEELIARADAALYRAKKAGRNRVEQG